MKRNKVLVLGILVLTLIFGLVFTGCSAKSDWEKALDDYEKFITEYAAFTKKYLANPTDPALMTQYMDLAAKATQAAQSVEKYRGNLTGKDLEKFAERYGKLYAKFLEAAGQ